MISAEVLPELHVNVDPAGWFVIDTVAEEHITGATKFNGFVSSFMLPGDNCTQAVRGIAGIVIPGKGFSVVSGLVGVLKPHEFVVPMAMVADSALPDVQFV
jgi:hypothetical protein